MAGNGVQDLEGTGLPKMSESEQNEAGSKAARSLPLFLVVARVIGFGVALLVFWLTGRATYLEQMSLLRSKDLGYLYLSVFVFSVLVTWLNMYPTIYKAMLGLKGNIRANMQFFKVSVPPDRGAQPYVVLEDEGVVGKYNRANRSLFHFGEYASGVVVNILCAGVVFPIPTFVLVLLFSAGRVLHQVGYTTGFGSHAAGFLIATLTTLILEGLVLVAGLGAFGAWG